MENVIFNENHMIQMQKHFASFELNFQYIIFSIILSLCVLFFFIVKTFNFNILQRDKISELQTRVYCLEHPL